VDDGRSKGKSGNKLSAESEYCRRLCPFFQRADLVDGRKIAGKKRRLIRPSKGKAKWTVRSGEAVRPVPGAAPETVGKSGFFIFSRYIGKRKHMI
jgi:hypothetical protein